MRSLWILSSLLSLLDFSNARTVNLDQLRLRLTRQVAPPSLPSPPRLPIPMPTNANGSDGGVGAQTPAPTTPPPPTTPADPAAACSQAANDPAPEKHKYDKLINAFRKCSRSGGNGGQPGAAGSSPSGSPGSSPSGSGAPSPGGFSGSGGSGMNVGGVKAGDQTSVNSSPGGDTSVSNKKGIDGIYTEENQTSAGKDGFQTSSKKCIAGQICTESGLGGGRR